MQTSPQHCDPRAKARVILREVAIAQKLDIAFWSYDRTRLLADGSVKIEGTDVAFHRHGAIYISRNSGIEKPQNLAGKRIGELALYGHDAGVIPKGILSDDFGVKPEQSRWVLAAP